MELYVYIESINEGSTKSSNEPIYLTVNSLNSVDDLKKSVIDYVVKNCTWKKIISFQVITRLDGRHDSIEKKYYQKYRLNIDARKERYEFPKGSSKGVLIWSQDAVINEA